MSSNPNHTPSEVAAMTDEQARIQMLEHELAQIAEAVAKGTAGKITAIKAIRAAKGFGLKESKEYVEQFAPLSPPAYPSMTDQRLDRLEVRLSHIERHLRSFPL